MLNIHQTFTLITGKKEYYPETFHGTASKFLPYITNREATAFKLRQLTIKRADGKEGTPKRTEGFKMGRYKHKDLSAFGNSASPRK